MNVQNITLDISKAIMAGQIIRMGQGDNEGTTIRATILDNSAIPSLSEMSAAFCMRLPDGVHYVRDSNCSISGNVVTYVVDEEHCCVASGYTDEAYFELVSGTTEYSTSRFRVKVERAANDGSAAPAGSWDTEIDAAIRRANEAAAEAEEAAQSVVDIPTMSTTKKGIAKIKANGGLLVDGEALGVDETKVVMKSEKGTSNGVAELDGSGKVPEAQLPSYVDDVLEYASRSAFPATGESGKIYVDKSDNKTYRWTGTTYVEISSSLALGETSSTAYRGDRGKVAYDHAQAKGSQFASGLYKIATNAEGHVTGAVSVQKSDITGLGIASDDVVTQSANGLMSSVDKKKLDDMDGSTDPITNAQIDTIASGGSITSTNVLQGTGLTYLWSKIKSKFAALSGGFVPVSQGGTGKGTHTSNAVLTGNGTNAVNNVPTASGAFYATSANGAAQFGTLPVAQGGTGVTANPSMLTNLASTSADDVLKDSPRPGVTGTLAIANGGTGATTATGAAENIVDGQAIEPASVAATGEVSAKSGTTTHKLTEKAQDTRADNLEASIAYVESTTAKTNHAVGDYFMLGNVLMRTTAAIVTGEQITTSNATPATVQGQIDTLRDSLTRVFESSGPVTDFNNTSLSGVYYYGPSAANMPDSANDPYGILLVFVGVGVWVHQLTISNNGRFFYRNHINNYEWSVWKTLHS